MMAKYRLADLQFGEGTVYISTGRSCLRSDRKIIEMSTDTGAMPFFDKQAEEYDRRSGRGLWKHVRTREAEILLSLAGELRGRSVLELGCGSGYYSSLLRDGGARVFGVDSSPRMITQLRKKGISGSCSDVGSLFLG